MLILERPWTRQPPAGTPANKEWVRVYGQYGFDAANNGARLSPGTQSYGAGSAGIGLKINAGAQVTTNEVIPRISSGITVVFIAEKFAKISSSDFILGEHQASSGAYNFGFYESASNGSLSFFIHNGSAGASAGTASGWVIDGGVKVFVGTYGDGDNNVCLYLNGAKVGSAAQTGNIQRNATAYLRSCFWQNGTANFRLYAAAIANRRMPGEEVASRFNSVKSSYKALFQPRRIPIPTPAAAGYTHPTLSAATALEIGATSFKPSVTYTFA